MVDYGARAGAVAAPSDWLDLPDLAAHDRVAHADLLTAATITFWADISRFQGYVDSTYPYPVLGFRADTGTSIDSHAAGNWGYVANHPDHIRVAIPYVVFKPGQRAAIMARLKNLFGSQCPGNIVPEIDMESGAGFAGPGDHSAEANGLAADLAAWTGDQNRVQGYANSPDWSGNWPNRPAWMKRRLAYYSSNANPVPAGFYAVQYYGALPYGSPAGWPRSCAPFGSYVDMNATPRTINQIVSDYGIGDPVSTLDSEDLANIANAVWHQKMQGTLSAPYQADVLLTTIRDIIATVRDNSTSAMNHSIASDTRTQQILTAVGALPSAQDIAQATVALLPATGGTGPTLQQITDAFTAVVNNTRLSNS